MSGSLFAAHGDVSQLSVDALVYSTDQSGHEGYLYAAFCRHVPDFQAAYTQALRMEGLSERYKLLPGETFWVLLSLEGRNVGRTLKGVVVVGMIGGNGARGR